MDKMVKELLRLWESNPLTGYGSPGEPEQRAGLWVGKAGARFFPAGFICNPANHRAEWGALLSGRMSIRYRDHLYPIQEGESYFLPPCCDAVALVEEAPFIVWFEVCGDSVEDFPKLCGFPAAKPEIRKARYTEIKTILEMALCLHRRSERFGYAAYARLWEFVANICKNGDEKHCPAISGGIRHVLQMVDQNEISRNYTLVKMAEISGLPTETFRKRFLAEVGMSPIQYILKKKLEHAKQLLIDGKRVWEVADALGFSDPYYFSRLFKRHMGISPKNYKKV